MALKDDDPLWEQHSGSDGHRGPEWGPSDLRRDAVFYRSLAGNARLIFDLLMDHPGQQVDSDRLAAQISAPARGQSAETARQGVAGSLSATGELAASAGRRLPFYWWKSRNGSASWYAMKPMVAALFREARQQTSAGSADAAAGTDWTAAEVAATVDDYLDMLAAEAAGQRYSQDRTPAGAKTAAEREPHQFGHRVQAPEHQRGHDRARLALHPGLHAHG